MNFASSKGFSLVEVLVAVALLGIAITALTGGLSTMTNSFRRTVERETLHRLAQQKLDELVATGDWETLVEGDFEDVRYEDYEWDLETQTTEVQDLEYLRVTVVYNGPTTTEAFAEGLVYRTDTVLVDGGAQ